MWSIYTMEYYPTIKNDETLLNEISQMKKEKLIVIWFRFHISNLKDKQNKTELRDIEKFGVSRGGGERKQNAKWVKESKGTNF